MNGCSDMEASPIALSMNDNARQKVDLAKYPSRFSLSHRVKRTLWGFVCLCLFRPSPRVFFAWRSALLRWFGAKIGPCCAIYPSCKIWAPWNLEMGERSALSDHVDCYCVDKVQIGSHVTVSQYSFLCTSAIHICGSLRHRSQLTRVPG